MKVIQFKQVPQKEKDELMRKMVAILRTKDLSDEENEVVEQAEVAVADYASIKDEIYNAKSIETLTGVVKKYQIEPNGFLADYARRRTVWLKCFDCKNGKTTKESAEKLLNKYKGAFRPDDIQKVIDFLNK
jgi:hypothetical protein